MSYADYEKTMWQLIGKKNKAKNLEAENERLRKENEELKKRLGKYE